MVEAEASKPEKEVVMHAGKDDDHDDGSNSSEDSGSESSMDSSEGSEGNGSEKEDDSDDEEGSDVDMDSDVDTEKFDKALDQLAGQDENPKEKEAEKKITQGEPGQVKSILKQPEVKKKELAVTVEEQKERVATEFATANST